MQAITLTSYRAGACQVSARVGLAIRPGCTVCQGPLLLAACLGVNPSGPAQRITDVLHAIIWNGSNRVAFSD
jgi:hypothetical protein